MLGRFQFKATFKWMSVIAWGLHKYGDLLTDTLKTLFSTTSWNSFRFGGCRGGKMLFSTCYTGRGAIAWHSHI